MATVCNHEDTEEHTRAGKARAAEFTAANRVNAKGGGRSFRAVVRNPSWHVCGI